MLAHFSAEHYSTNASTSVCLDPPSCREWSQAVALHMEHVLARAEGDFTNFLNYDPHRIICLDETVVEEVDRLGLSWRALAKDTSWSGTIAKISYHSSRRNSRRISELIRRGIR